MNSRSPLKRGIMPPSALAAEDMMDFMNQAPGRPGREPGPPMNESESDPSSEKLILGRFESMEDLMEAFLRLEAKLETMNSQRPKKPVGAKAGGKNNGVRNAQVEEFWEDLGRAYQQDPLLTTHMMIVQANEDLMEDIESRLESVMEARSFKEELKEIIDQPENSQLKGYKKHLEYLSLDKGLDPVDAADFLLSIVGDQSTGKRAMAARNVRNQSTMEVGQGRRRPGQGADGDFDKVLKKSKTLNEMFEGLRKIPL